MVGRPVAAVMIHNPLPKTVGRHAGPHLPDACPEFLPSGGSGARSGALRRSFFFRRPAGPGRPLDIFHRDT